MIQFVFGNGDPEFSMQILTPDKKEMETFLRQHNFLKADQPYELFERANYLRYHEYCKMEHMTMDILQKYIFRSNETEEEFVILTTENIMARVIEGLGNDLSEKLVFGEIILQQEFQFIDVIQKSINSLPHVAVLDFMALEGDDTSGTNQYMNDKFGDRYRNIIKNKKNHNLDDSLLMKKAYSDYSRGDQYDHYGDNYILESFYDDSYVGALQPITIECYVSGVRAIQQIYKCI